MSIPASQDRNVTTDIKRNFKRWLTFIGVIALNPVAYVCLGIDLLIFFCFGFIWQILATKSSLRPFILTRMWADVGYKHVNGLTQKKKKIIRDFTKSIKVLNTISCILLVCFFIFSLIGTFTNITFVMVAFFLCLLYLPILIVEIILLLCSKFHKFSKKQLAIITCYILLAIVCFILGILSFIINVDSNDGFGTASGSMGAATFVFALITMCVYFAYSKFCVYKN